MMKDKYGKEFKVGDTILYDMCEYTVTAIEENMYPRGFGNTYSKSILRATNKYGKKVQLPYWQHSAIITGLDLHTRYGEPSDVR